MRRKGDRYLGCQGPLTNRQQTAFSSSVRRDNIDGRAPGCQIGRVKLLRWCGDQKAVSLPIDEIQRRAGDFMREHRQDMREYFRAGPETVNNEKGNIRGASCRRRKGPGV